MHESTRDNFQRAGSEKRRYHSLHTSNCPPNSTVGINTRELRRAGGVLLVEDAALKVGQSDIGRVGHREAREGHEEEVPVKAGEANGSAEVFERRHLLLLPDPLVPPESVLHASPVLERR